MGRTVLGFQPSRFVLLGLCVLGASLVAILMLAGPASARAGKAGPGCVAASAPVVSVTAGRASAGVQAGGIETSVEAAAEFGLPRTAAKVVRFRWLDRVAYADAPGTAPSSIADGSPHRPPRAA